MTHDIPSAVIAAYEISPTAGFERVSGGLINATWFVQDAQNGNRRRVLQKLNRIFDASVNATIADVSEFLSGSPASTTRLIQTADGAFQVIANGECWRCLSYVPGRTYAQISDIEQAAVAGKALGNFHAMMADYPAQDNLPVLKVHDLARHCDNLVRTQQNQKDHRNYATVSRVAEEILGEVAELSGIPVFSPAALHGDPKITNFIFDDCGTRACLVDLDTIGRGQVLYELGDAFRSWCNPKGEEKQDTYFDLEIFARGIDGYLSVSGTPLNAVESKYIGVATQMICLELAARFCADALNESYFAWDAQRYSSAGEHQLSRACGQLNLAKSVGGNIEGIWRTVEKAWH